MKEGDACKVLRLLRGHEPASPKELGRLCELSSVRLAAVLTFLREKGLIDAPDKRKSKIDRRALFPRINADYGHVIGVDIGGSNLRIALADLQGNVLGKWATSTKSTSSPAMVIKQIREGANHLLQQASVPRGSLLAIAAGAPGITDRQAGIVFATSYLKGWKNVPLGPLLQDTFGIPAAVENDVKLAAIGENWRGAARGIRNFAFLAIGTGIAAGIFVNGQLLHGPDWVAGEVGYMIVPGTPDAPAKRGTPGSLESIIGGEGIKQQWLRARAKRRSEPSEDLTATGIFYHALTGDRLAKSILEESARILAFAVYNISAVLNCSLFVLGGGVGMSKPLLDATERILEPYTQPSRPRLLPSALGQDAQLMGAIRLALDQAESRIDLKLP
jgi:glucokinase